MSRVREMGMEQEAGAWPLAQSRENMNGETEVYVFMSRFTAKPKMDGFRAQMVDCIPGWRRDDFFSLLWRLRNWHLCEQPETEPMMWQCMGISTVRHPQELLKQQTLTMRPKWGGVALTVRSIQAGKSKNAVTLLQQSSDITQGDFARAEILCVCTMIRATKMGAVPAPVTPSCPQAGFKSRAGSHLRPFLFCKCNPGFLPISPCFSHAPAHGTLRTLCDQE